MHSHSSERQAVSKTYSLFFKYIHVAPDENINLQIKIKDAVTAYDTPMATYPGEASTDILNTLFPQAPTYDYAFV